MLTAGWTLSVAPAGRDHAQAIARIDLTYVGIGSFTNTFV